MYYDGSGKRKERQERAIVDMLRPELNREVAGNVFQKQDGRLPLGW